MADNNMVVPCEKCGGNVIEYTRFFNGWLPGPRQPKVHRDLRAEFGLPNGGDFELCGACRDGSVMKRTAASAAAPATSVSSAPQAAGDSVAQAMKGAMWPPYNPMTGEDLTDKLRAALEANHKKAIILTLADAAATLKDMAEELAAELKDKAVEGV